jgi:predicted amidophosphoribosyltransferase
MPTKRRRKLECIREEARKAKLAKPRPKRCYECGFKLPPWREAVCPECAFPLEFKTTGAK